MLNQLPSPEKFPTWKIVISHWLDLCVVTASMMMVIALSSSYKSIIFTSKSMQTAGEAGFSATAITFGLILWAHFFFSYFLNHGQTVGLFAMKRRVLMKDKSFRDAVYWSLISFATCLSGGLLPYVMKLNDHYARHDYLYHHLLNVKEVTSINLLEWADKKEQAPAKVAQAA